MLEIKGYSDKHEYLSPRGIKSTVYLMDCLEGLKQIPKGLEILAVVDPEFGIGIGHSPRLVKDKGWAVKDWDNKPIDAIYFVLLFGVSKNQIIWGANYYEMPPTKHCIIWDKLQPENLSFGMFDFAWTSYEGANKIFRKSVQDEKDKIHPTQKPVKLYSWIYKNYSKPTDIILDTHLGSQSSRIAADMANLEFIGFELDADYFREGCKRFDNYTKQLKLEL